MKVINFFQSHKTFYDRINLNSVNISMSSYYNKDFTIIQNLYSSKQAYYLRDKCVDDLKYESRKKLRWVYSSVTRVFFGFIEYATSYKISFLTILLYHFSIFLLTFYIIQKSIFSLFSSLSTQMKDYLYLVSSLIFSYILYWTHLKISGYFEFYTPFETLIISALIYFSIKKNIYMFTSFLILGILNRESAFILSLLWIVPNNIKNLKTYIPLFLSLIIFVFVNYDVMHCLQNKEFLSPTLSDQDMSLFAMLLKSIFNIHTIYFIAFTSLLTLKPEKKILGIYIIYMLYALVLFKSSPSYVYQTYFLFTPMIIIIIVSNVNKIYLKFLLKRDGVLIKKKLIDKKEK